MESPRRSRPRAGTATRGEEPTQEQGVWGELPPVVQTHIGAVLEELLPVGSPHRISLGRMASRRRDPIWSRGRE